jgi:hypothetical protein
MTTDRIIEIHQATAYPESRSVYQALLQVWNECEQERNKIEAENFCHYSGLPSPQSYVEEAKCYDKYNQLLKDGDYVDVQKDGVQQIYKKDDGELYFKPYGEEDRVSAYFSNDIVKCDEVGNWITNDRYETIEDVENVSYSEEEIQFNVNNLLNTLLKGKMHSNMIAEIVNEWFGKFKKK